MSLKGKALIAQSGGCTAVINQSLIGAALTAKSSRSITEVWGARFAVDGILKNDWINLGRQPISLLKEIQKQPSAALGSSRHKLKSDEELVVLEHLQKNDIRYLFMIGGNDTSETLLRISHAAQKKNYELRAIHIPKTIDNDLMETDHCPGFGSIARFAAISTQEAGLDSRAMLHVDRVKIIELMGRNSGWIVAASALLKQKEKDPPHLLWLPEVPFEKNLFLNRVESVLSHVGYCVVVISETIREANGARVGARKDGVTQDPFGHPYVDGAAATLARMVEEAFKVRARFDKPGTISRMSMPYISEVDQKEAFECGKHAVKWALRGKSRIMVGMKRLKNSPYQISYLPVPLEKIPNRERYMPATFLSSDRSQISNAFKKYALPLLGKHLPSYPSLPGF